MSHLRWLFAEIAKVARNAALGVPHNCGAVTHWSEAARTGRCAMCGGELPPVLLRGGK